MDILQPKEYPLNYPADVLEVISLLAYDMEKVQIMGSQSLRSQLYAADYDLYEEVNPALKHSGLALQKIVLRFQEKIKQISATPNVFITDIKAGLLPELEIIPEESYVSSNTIHNFSKEKSLSRLEDVRDMGAISESEYEDFKARFDAMETPEDFLLLKKDLRFHIVRWTPTEVARNRHVSPIGSLSLQYAFCCPSIVKVDLIAYLESARKFSEFSIIYKFQNNRTIFNRFAMDPQKELRQNILYLSAEGAWFKIAKRMFSLARLNDWNRDLEALNEILNSDLGILYSIMSDAETVLFLLENESQMPLSKIRGTLEGFRQRLGNIYSVDADRPSVLQGLLKSETLPATKEGRDALRQKMVRLVDFFSVLLNKHAEEALQQEGFIPLLPKYKPDYNMEIS
jgi:hypothetical protein